MNIILEKFKGLLKEELNTFRVQIRIIIKDSDNIVLDCDSISLNNYKDIKSNIINNLEEYYNVDITNHVDDINFKSVILKDCSFIYSDYDSYDNEIELDKIKSDHLYDDYSEYEIKENKIILKFDYLSDDYIIEVTDYNPEYYL